MRYRSFFKEKQQKEAVKRDFSHKIAVLTIIYIVLLLLFLASEAFAIEFWVFENYSLGNINGQFGWTSSVSTHTITTTTLPYAPSCIFGDRCLKVHGESVLAGKGAVQSNQAVVSIGELSFYGTRRTRVYLKTVDGNWIDLQAEANECPIPDDGEFHYWAGQWAPNLPAGYVEARCKIDSGAWQEWTPAFESLNPTTSDWEANGFAFTAITDYGLVDFIAYGSALEECGSGDNCILCDTQGECLSKGCDWIALPFGEGYCSEAISPIETETSTYDWTTYYSENSDFATPTALFGKLATMTQPFLAILSSWLSGFSDKFDMAEAQIKGGEYGLAIPTARGYLEFFNGFFSDFPIGEALIIYLVVLIGIIIFRIIRQIKKLLIA